MFEESKLARLKDSKSKVLCSITVDGQQIGDAYMVPSIEGSAASDVQIDTSFGGHMFVSAFGEKLTNMSFSCLSFPQDSCGITLASVTELYTKYRAGTNVPTPLVSIVFDGSTFKGLLTGMALRPYQLATGIQDALAFTLSVTGKIV